MDSTLPPTSRLPQVEAAVQAALDANHLQLLEIGFYISGILTAIRFLWFSLIVAALTIAGSSAAYTAQHAHALPSGSTPPAVVFFVMACVFGVFILFTLIFAGLEIYAGRCLKRREHPLLIQIVAAFYCLSIPWGTALGVFTFMVLNRNSVKPLFEQK